jgi:ABC-type Fe3+/spermidine/putrescine transport system ATPase subunit
MISTPLIRLMNVSKSYSVENPAAVSDVNLSISKGDFAAIIGESGSGKSTLLKMIFGTVSPNGGEIFYNEEHVLGPHEKLIPGHEKMKMVTQDFNLNPYARVYDNIAGMLSNEDIEAKQHKTWEMMEFLGIDKLAEKRIVDLSGGEQQRVAIARAIITEPEVLLLDEPFSQIDAILKNQLRADLKRLCQYLGITIILVSHDPQDALSLADHLVVIQKGRIIQEGTPKQITENPVSGYIARLLGNASVFTSRQANECFGLRIKSDQELIIYPHDVTLGSGEMDGIVKQIHFYLFYDLLHIQVGNCILKAVSMPVNLYGVGENVLVELVDYHVSEINA